MRAYQLLRGGLPAAEIAEFADGQIALRWLPGRIQVASTVLFASLLDLQEVLGGQVRELPVASSPPDDVQARIAVLYTPAIQQRLRAIIALLESQAPATHRQRRQCASALRELERILYAEKLV